MSETGGGNLGNVSGQIPGASYRQWQEAGRHREKQLNLYHQSGALQGKAQPHVGLKGQKDLPRVWLGVGPGHITQEHPRGHCP